MPGRSTENEVRWLRNVGTLGYCSYMLDRADDLAAMTVLDPEGKPVALGTLWRDKPAVLVFVRHFG